MKFSLTSLICSPLDGSPLKLEITESSNEEIKKGFFVDSSGNRFPIVEGVPLFAQEAATDETFAFKWRLIGDSYGYEQHTRSVRQNWYLERFGFDTRNNLMDFLQQKDFILDAGTGTGVDAAMFAQSGATVVAVDLSLKGRLSDSVESFDTSHISDA